MVAHKTTNGWQKKLERYLTGRTSEGKDGTTEHQAWCPIHEIGGKQGGHKSPSAHFNFDLNVWHCKSDQECHLGLRTFSQLWEAVRYDYIDEDSPAGKRKSNVDNIDSARKKDPLPSEDTVRGWHDYLMETPHLLEVMTEGRGYTKETLQELEIGYNTKDHRYTFPVRDLDGVLRNVRRYQPGKKQSQDKMWNVSGHGGARLFMPWVIRDNDEVVLFEGEPDAVLAHQLGLPAFTHTAGAGTWMEAWEPAFDGKTVFICYDNDSGGKAGADKVAFSLSETAKAVHRIILPVPNSDFSDYVLKQGHTVEDFRGLMDKAREDNESVGPAKFDPSEVPETVPLEDSQKSSLKDKPLLLTVTVRGKATPAHILPKEVHLKCKKDWQTSKCQSCPMSALHNGDHTVNINAYDKNLLGYIDKNEEQREMALLKSNRIPHRCPKVKIEHLRSWNAEELIVTQSVDVTQEEKQNPIDRKVYYVNENAYDTQINQTYQLKCFNTTDPRGSRGVLQAWECSQTNTNIERFTLTDDVKEALSLFRPAEGQGPLAKMKEIAADLSANVTHIYGREPLHLAYDAVWHSVMDFNFNGVPVNKGWLEMLVIGDTRTGKSEAAQRLVEHYGAGVLKSCEGATLAGLVGGVEQRNDGGWLVRWGLIPLNDRRLVVLDEVSGMAGKDIFDQMSAIRSSGKAQLTKIAGAETSARTRLIWVSNPVSGHTILDHNDGAIDAIKDLIKNPEDISRFDLATSAAGPDVEAKVINSETHDEVPHVYTKEMCSNLVMWVWSRKRDDVTWEPGVESYVMSTALRLGGRYLPNPPLIQVENARIKLARIAVAIAARTFSTDETCEKIVVTQAHVQAAENLLNGLYKMDSFGYEAASQRALRLERRAEKMKPECEAYLIDNPNVFFVLSLVRSMNHFKVLEFQNQGGMIREDASEAIRTLVGFAMLEQLNKGNFKMRKQLIEVLRKMDKAEVRREMLEEKEEAAYYSSN